MIVVDTSAIVAILLEEEDGAEFADLVHQHEPVLVSAGNAVELALVSSRSASRFDDAMEFLSQPYVRIEPVDADQVAVAAKAYRRFGKGHHPARLNYGDMFAYALARSRGLPLLFKGDDFTQTDITPVTSPSDRDLFADLEVDESTEIHQRIPDF